MQWIPKTARHCVLSSADMPSLRYSAYSVPYRKWVRNCRCGGRPCGSSRPAKAFPDEDAGSRDGQCHPSIGSTAVAGASRRLAARNPAFVGDQRNRAGRAYHGGSRSGARDQYFSVAHRGGPQRGGMQHHPCCTAKKLMFTLTLDIRASKNGSKRARLDGMLRCDPANEYS